MKHDFYRINYKPAPAPSVTPTNDDLVCALVFVCFVVLICIF